MPVSPRSRYATTPVYDPGDSSAPAIIGIREAPVVPAGAAYRHTVSDVETMEYLAWRVYGDASLWWRIADANPARFPLDFAPGDTVLIPTDTEAGRVVRTRTF